jgi:NADH dehydrogenase FAD-containing subunit
VQGFDNIYAIGDIAYMETPKYPNGHPQVANVAINQGKNLAKISLKKHKKIGLNMNIQIGKYGNYWQTQSCGRFAKIQISRIFRLVFLDVSTSNAYLERKK